MTVGADPFRYFRVEAAEILEELGKGILALERGARPADLVPNLLRLAHTLKGAARVVKHVTLAELAHAIEDVLVPLREQSSPLERDRVAAALALLDGMAAQVATLDRPPGEEGPRLAPAAIGAPTLQRPPEAPAARADVAEMDALLERLSEAQVSLDGLRAVSEPLVRARRLAERAVAEVEAGEALLPGPTRASLDELRAVLRELERTFEGALDRASRELGLAREGAAQLQLMKASTVFASLERAARDVAHATGKRVTFTARGGEVRLDAYVLGVLHAALLQLVRNAVAHGVETERERVAAGKPPAGALELVVSRQGRRALFVCRDDGRGVDLEGVRRVVRERGLGAAEAHRLDQAELLSLLMVGGITTSRVVTQLAGRGVGLDVVREAVQRLGGQVQVRTEASRGTTFEIAVPVSVASLEALVVEAGGLRAALPVDAVRGALRVHERDVTETATGAAIVHENETIPFVPLASLLGRPVAPRERSAGGWPAVVLGAGGSSVALAVDRLLGTETLVLRALSPLAAVDPIVSAASLDAAGDPQLVLDPEALVRGARQAVRSERVSPLRARLPLLVIDDSLTTRMLEQSILESAGYAVDVASSAEEGLEKATIRRYGLYLVDVEMPGMDGFTFVERTRADPRFRDTPAILVTSRGSPEDRRRGAAAGAGAYIVKGDFDQTELLRTIRRLLGEA